MIWIHPSPGAAWRGSMQAVLGRSSTPSGGTPPPHPASIGWLCPCCADASARRAAPGAAQAGACLLPTFSANSVPARGCRRLVWWWGDGTKTVIRSRTVSGPYIIPRLHFLVLPYRSAEALYPHADPPNGRSVSPPLPQTALYTPLCASPSATRPQRISALSFVFSAPPPSPPRRQ